MVFLRGVSGQYPRSGWYTATVKRSIQRAGAAVLLALTLVGCAEAQQVRDQADQVISQAQELGDLTRESVENFDWNSLSEYQDIYLGDNSRVVQFFRSMPSGPDMETFQIQGDEGKLIVNYGDEATTIDPAVLQTTMEEVAAQAKERVQNLETVEFHVGDKTYTF